MRLVNTPEVCQETLFDILNWFVKIRKLYKWRFDWWITKSQKTKMTSSYYKIFISISLFTIQQIFEEKKKKDFGVSCVSDLVKHGYKTK